MVRITIYFSPGHFQDKLNVFLNMFEEFSKLLKAAVISAFSHNIELSMESIVVGTLYWVEASANSPALLIDCRVDYSPEANIVLTKVRDSIGAQLHHFCEVWKVPVPTNLITVALNEGPPSKSY